MVDLVEGATMKSNFRQISPQELRRACNAVIDALKPFPPETKFAALNTLMDSFPDKENYGMVTYEKWEDVVTEFKWGGCL